MSPTQQAPRKRLTTSAKSALFADPGQRTARAPFGHALNRLAEERREISGLSADLAKYTDMHVRQGPGARRVPGHPRAALARNAYDRPAGHYSGPDDFSPLYNPGPTECVRRVGPRHDLAVKGPSTHRRRRGRA
ncbi:hypothetical protein ACWD04_10945 [Streptomyces sp. NPDC002911]